MLAIQFDLSAYLSSSKRNLDPDRQRHSLGGRTYSKLHPVTNQREDIVRVGQIIHVAICHSLISFRSSMSSEGIKRG